MAARDCARIRWHMGCQEDFFRLSGIRRRPTQAWVSCSGRRTTGCDPHALGGDQCGEQRCPELKHSTTHSTGGSGGVWFVNGRTVPRRRFKCWEIAAVMGEVFLEDEELARTALSYHCAR